MVNFTRCNLCRNPRVQLVEVFDPFVAFGTFLQAAEHGPQQDFGSDWVWYRKGMTWCLRALLTEGFERRA